MVNKFHSIDLILNSIELNSHSIEWMCKSCFYKFHFSNIIPCLTSPNITQPHLTQHFKYKFPYLTLPHNTVPHLTTPMNIISLPHFTIQNLTMLYPAGHNLTEPYHSRQYRWMWFMIPRLTLPNCTRLTPAEPKYKRKKNMRVHENPRMIIAYNKKTIKIYWTSMWKEAYHGK